MEARRPSNNINNPPLACQCRCPCHSVPSNDYRTMEAQGDGQIYSNGMSWAEGAVRFTVPPTNANNSPNGNNPFNSNGADPKPIKATECFSKSLLHVTNIVKTMKSRFDSMSENVDDNSRRTSKDAGTTPSQCLACTSSHKWNSDIEPEGSTNSAEIRRSLGIDDRRSYGRGGHIEHRTYSLEPLRFNENLPMPERKSDEMNPNKRRSSDKALSPPPLPPRRDSYELKKAAVEVQTSLQQIKDSGGPTARAQAQTFSCPYLSTNPFVMDNVPQDAPKDEAKPCPCNQDQQIQIKELQKVSGTQLMSAQSPSKQTCFTQLAQENGRRCEFYRVVNEHEVNASKSALSNTRMCDQQKSTPSVHRMEKGIVFMLCEPEPSQQQPGGQRERLPKTDEKRDTDTRKCDFCKSSAKINGSDSVGLSRCSTAVLTSFVDDVLSDAVQAVEERNMNGRQVSSEKQETLQSKDNGSSNQAQGRNKSLEKDERKDATYQVLDSEKADHDEDDEDETIMTKILSLGNWDYDHETIITRMMSESEEKDEKESANAQEKTDQVIPVESPESKDNRKDSIDIKSDKSAHNSGSQQRITEDDSSYMAWISVPNSSFDEQQNDASNPAVRPRKEKGLISLEIGSNPPIRTAIPMDPGATVLIRLSEKYDSLVQHPSSIQIETVARSTSQNNLAAKKVLYQNRTLRRLEAVVQSGGGGCPCTTNINKVNQSTMANVVMAMHCQTKQFHICHKCQKIVSKDEGRFHLVGEHYTAWHPQCFKCNECEKALVDNDYNFFDEEPYCMKHFLKEANIPKCGKCGELIFDKTFTSAGGKAWHKDHFYCYSCKTTLVNTKFILEGRKHPYCFKCHERDFSKTCRACSKLIHINDPYVETGEFHWHSNESCLRCAACEGSLLGRPFLFRRASQLFCSRYCGVRET